MALPPSFYVPPGAVAGASIIDTTFRVANIPTTSLMTPLLPGFETLPTVPTWSWLIESSDGRLALFDLGVPRDPQKSYSPALYATIQKGANITVEREVADTLEAHGINLEDIDSIIWSHWHWDHVGDPSAFPNSTDLVVGPGFKENLLPAYPTNPDSYVMESHLSGRNLREIDFNDNPELKVGDFPAYDFFGDGSFFLLDIPGHAIGHLGGLARTSSNPDTFIFMGADLCHHGAAVRPSKFLPYPHETSLPLSHLEHLQAAMSFYSCPGARDFIKLNKEVNKSVDEPIFGPAVFSNEEDAIETVKKAQYADAREDVWFTFAHDATMEGVVEEFPAKANEWKKRGWKETLMWRFLKDLVPALELVEKPHAS